MAPSLARIAPQVLKHVDGAHAAQRLTHDSCRRPYGRPCHQLRLGAQCPDACDSTPTPSGQDTMRHSLRTQPGVWQQKNLPLGPRQVKQPNMPRTTLGPSPCSALRSEQTPHHNTRIDAPQETVHGRDSGKVLFLAAQPPKTAHGDSRTHLLEQAESKTKSLTIYQHGSFRNS